MERERERRGVGVKGYINLESEEETVCRQPEIMLLKTETIHPFPRTGTCTSEKKHKEGDVRNYFVFQGVV